MSSVGSLFPRAAGNLDTWAFLGVNVLGVLGLIVFGIGRTRISVDGQHLVIYRGPLALPPRKRRIPLSEIVNVSADKRLSDASTSKGYWIFLSCKNGRKIKLLSQQPSDESKDIIEQFIAQQASKR